MSPKLEIPVDKAIEKSFAELQEIEKEIQKADAKVEQFKNELFTPIYRKRRDHLQEIPDFWYIVLAQHEDFQEYVTIEDMKYMDLIDDLYVEFWDETKESDDLNSKGFSITMKFKSSNNADNKITEQTVTKKFAWKIDPETGSRKLESEPVSFIWPEALKKIDPQAIKDTAKNEKRALTSDEKKRYRQGMRSFFSFWQWTGLKPGKEFRNGEELATFIAEDIFPAALDYYVLAAPGLNGEEGDEDDEVSGEELDLSEDDEEGDNDHNEVGEEGHISKKQKI
ncbi:hypothetical protein CANINC_002216 [Pichia inconspicua]|uniref:Vacuolar protein sorting-associated protein 75 n=1 Tax=Pichia inconspicua TaxID=52247 RepID=A0A4T0X1R8_9ASCO|nr:hypothetical protein CANINC_002216 [[Candida] inconspicua]